MYLENRLNFVIKVYGFLDGTSLEHLDVRNDANILQSLITQLLSFASFKVQAICIVASEKHDPRDGKPSHNDPKHDGTYSTTSRFVDIPTTLETKVDVLAELVQVSNTVFIVIHCH